MTKTANFWNPRWRTAAILKITKSPYLSEKSSDFDKIWYTKADIEPDDMTVTWPKIEIFKIQDGGGRHLENLIFGQNSSTDSLISAKFCMRKRKGMSTRATWQKLQIFKIQDGGRPPFWRSLNRHISVKILRLWWNFLHYSRYWTRWQSRNQKLKFLKFKIATAAILKIAFFSHNSLTDFPISAKFCTRKQNGMSTRPTWQKLQTFEIQDGGRPPFWR